MRSSGRLYAFDANERRLAGLGPRLKRSGLSNVHPVVIRNESDVRVKRLNGKCDRVLVDARVRAAARYAATRIYGASAKPSLRASTTYSARDIAGGGAVAEARRTSGLRHVFIADPGESDGG